MRFHLLGLAHLPCSKAYMSCAFTQKNHKLSRMLLSLGHEVFYYGAESSDLPCTEFIQTHSLRDIRKDYGDGDNRFDIGYNWHRADFRHDFNEIRKPSTIKFYKKCVSEIQKRKKPDDFLLLSQGFYHKPIADEIKLFLTCEPGIGYRGSYARFRAFESSYIQNFAYGSENPRQCINGKYYDRVIPNYFDPSDILYSADKQDYYLFIGRIIRRKGLNTAVKACNALGRKLIIAGQSASIDSRGYLISSTDPGFNIAPGTWEYIGFADIEKRKELMAHALATFTPTEYLECFAGVHIESMLSGTPVITTNFGVFPETIPDNLNGKVGFRCNTLQDFIDAAQKVIYCDHYEIRKYADRFLMQNIALEFDRWFRDLYQLYLSAKDSKIKGWHYLNLGKKENAA